MTPTPSVVPSSAVAVAAEGSATAGDAVTRRPVLARSCTIGVMKTIWSILCHVAIVLLVVPASAAPVKELDLIMPQLEIDRKIAEQIAELVDEESGLKINLIPPPENGVTTLDALESGYGDIAFALNNAQFRESITTIMPLYPSVLQVLAKADRPAANLSEFLFDAEIFAGPPGSMSRLLTQELIDDLEFTEVDLTLVDHLEPIPDIIIVYAPIDRGRLIRDPSLAGMKLFSFGDPAEIGMGTPIDRAVLLNPRLRPFIIPVGTFGDLTPEVVVTLAVDRLLVSRADLPNTVAYDLFEEILRQRPALFSARPELYQPIEEDLAHANLAFSLHPGALAFIKRDEPTFIERYSGVGEVVVALVVALVSASVALVKFYRVRRKNRLDKFLVRVIDIRNSVTPDSTDAQRAEAIDEIKALQDYGFEQLVNEKLAADESFRIFIELTNNTIAELQNPGA